MLVNYSTKAIDHHHHTINLFLGTLKYLYPSTAGALFQKLDIKYQLDPIPIQNVFHLYFMYESKIQHRMSFLALWKYLWSINDSLQIYRRFLGWITQLYNFLVWNKLYLRIYHLLKNQSQIARQLSKYLQVLNNYK